jgi:hypothetical protein
VLTTRERGRLARELAEKEHTDPFGRQVKVSRGTIDRRTRDYRGGEFAAPVPEPRKAVPRTPPEVLELAAALKRENPAVGVHPYAVGWPSAWTQLATHLDSDTAAVRGHSGSPS